MPANFISDPHKGAGYGIIEVHPIQCNDAPTFALVNASNRLCLSPEGWQNSEVFLEPTEWHCENDLLRLFVGPQVVDNLDSLDLYKLSVKDASGAVTSFNLAIEDILQSSMTGGDGMGAAAPVAAAAVVAPVVTPEPEPESEPEPEPTPPAPLPEVDMPPQEPPKRNLLPIIIGICLLCALLGGALWWYFTQYKGADAQDPTQTEEQQKKDDAAKDADATKDKEGDADKDKDAAAKDADSGKTPEGETPADKGAEGANGADNASGAGSSSTGSGSASLSPLASARELLSKNDTGEKSHELATSLKPQVGNDANAQDAVFLLLEDAAQKGVGGAMRELGDYYDPSTSTPKGSIMPDGQEARSWYTKAQEAGDANADAALQNLRTWAEEEAKKGNATAKSLLESWKQ